MHKAGVRTLCGLIGVGCLVSCAAPESAAAQSPKQATADRDRQIRRDQRELEQRRLQLQTQLLTELRKLKSRRQASTDGAEAARDDATESAADDKLMVFGGAHHEVFIGCLCEEHDSDSVFNMMGEYGSDFSNTSIRNKFAPYGSNHDDTSACNTKAQRPPVVLTSKGKSLGLLSLNPSLERRIAAQPVLDWLSRMCGE
jgi:hypothetical protein